MSKFLPEKVSDGLFKLKTYWNKPPKGYYVCYKEFVNLSLGFGVVSFLSVLVGMATFDVNRDMMIHYNVSLGQVWLFTIINVIIGIIRAPIMSMCIDNCKSKHGKFKPFILPATIATCVIFCITPFIPVTWNSNVLASINVPALPWLGLTHASTIVFTPAIITMWVLIILGGTANTFVTQAVTGIEQTITPISQERSTIASLRGLICNIPSSVANAIPGILLMFGAFKQDTIGGKTIFPLITQQILFPICSICAIALVFFVVRGTKERVVITNTVKEKVSFWDGAKALSTNKYFWIIVVYQIIITIRANVNIVDFIRQYSYPGNPALAGFIEVIGKTVLMTAFVVGMVVGPIVMKKFGKRKVMITANVGFVTFSLLQLATYKIPIIVVFCTFFQNVFAGFDFITCIMTSDALDFEQYRHGKRVEGFWQNFMAMITTVASLFVTMVPVFLAAAAGIGFGDDYAEKMTDLVTRENLYLYRSLVGVAAGAIAAIPIFFYDMTEKQHSSIVKALRIRAAKDDFATGTITDGQIVELKGIVDYAYEYNDSFIIGKITEFAEIEQVLAMYDEAKAREDAIFAQEELENFERNIELETKKLDAKIAKQKEVCAKKNIEFDEKNFVEELVYHNRWLIRLEQYADIKARKDADNIVAEKAKFDSQIAKEEAKYAKMIAKEKSKCLKKNIEFNESDFRKDFIYNSKHIIRQKDFTDLLTQRDNERTEKAKEKTILEIQKVNRRLEKIKVKI